MEDTKEYIYQAIEELDGDDLNEVCLLIRKLVSEKSKSDKKSLFSKLREIRVEGPKDFATDIDAYILGKKNA